MTASERSSALIGWRLLALLYDFFPMLALWFLAATVFTLLHGDAVRGGWLGALEFAVFWGIAGVYATYSWRHGGQTIGMRAWRLCVTDTAGGIPSPLALWQRYAMSFASLLLGGLGFWWAWIDRDQLTWHDRLSKTRVIRLPKH